ncbi:MAG: contractile injection system tape measure protein [Saprospiraceae bacterium]|nr:contractile injection system tape measure protein [Saprospiraceae bacterium]
MDNRSRHIIHKINTNVNCSAASFNTMQGLDINELIKSAIGDVEDKLDDLGISNRLLFDSITLDLQVEKMDLYALREKIVEELIHKLDAYIISEQKAEKEASIQLSKQFSDVEALIYFLKNGSLPWSVKSVSLNFESCQPNKDRSHWVQALSECLYHQPQTVTRLVNQFKQDDILSFLKRLTTDRTVEDIRTLSALVKNRSAKHSKVYDLSYRLNLILMELVVIQATKVYLDSSINDFKWEPVLLGFVQRIIDDYPQLSIGFYAAVFSDIPFLTSDNWKKWVNIPQNNPSASAENAILKELDTNNADESSTLEIHNLKNPFDEKIDSLVNDFKPSVSSEIADQEDLKYGVLVQNAGIILLHPFLTTFFKKVGLLENGKFISNACKQRAICLLHYIASGEEEFPEELLSFQKYICNYPIQADIPKHLPISTFEKQEVESLLHAVLSHWSKMKGTSIQGLRGNFLIRKGVLREDDNEAMVHVEHQTADVLLNSLPWGLNIAKFPWHTTLLTIKWS